MCHEAIAPASDFGLVACGGGVGGAVAARSGPGEGGVGDVHWKRWHDGTTMAQII
ncbi:hypothetical protein [Sphingomonas sp. DC4000-5]|uniref:hypothetical protein n=1 Tax=Sphingomonas sp. DC4000-5 TaxID=2804606 RepID=UPI003CF83B1D